MNEQTEQSEQTAAPESAMGETPGHLLTQARKSSGLGISAVADALHLSESVVEDLEADRYDRLPPVTFVRGYLRGYAKLVGLMEHEVLAAFERIKPSERAPDLHNSPGRGKSEVVSGGRGWLVLVVFALLAVGVWWAYQTADLSPADPSDNGAETATEVSGDAAPERGESSPYALVEREERVVAEDESAAPEVVESPTGRVEPIDNSGMEAGAETSGDDAPEPLADSGPDLTEQTDTTDSDATPPPDGILPTPTEGLRVTVDGESWLNIQDADGVVLYNGLRRGAQGPLNLDGARPFSLVIGAPTAVQLIIDGEVVDLSRYRPGQVARIQVPAR